MMRSDALIRRIAVTTMVPSSSSIKKHRATKHATLFEHAPRSWPAGPFRSARATSLLNWALLHVPWVEVRPPNRGNVPRSAPPNQALLGTTTTDALPYAAAARGLT